MHKIKYGRAPFNIDGKRFFAHANFCWNHQKNGVEILVQRMSKDSFWWYVKVDSTNHIEDGICVTKDHLVAAKEALLEVKNNS